MRRRGARVSAEQRLDPIVATLVSGYAALQGYSEADQLRVLLLSERALFAEWRRRRAEVLAAAEGLGVVAAAIAWFDERPAEYLQRWAAEPDDA